MKQRLSVLLTLISGILFIIGLYATFFYTPTVAAEMGFSQKIFYFHMPMGIAAFIAFAVNFATSILYLVKRSKTYDIWAYSSAEVGLVFASMLMVMGMAWNKAAWGTWWAWWEWRIVSFLIMMLLYAAYFILRRSIDEVDRRARYGAAYAIVAFITVPFSALSTRILSSSLHPVVITGQGFQMEPLMTATLLIAMVAVNLLLIPMLLLKVSLEEYKYEIEDLKDSIGGIR